MTMSICPPVCLSPSLRVSMKYIYGNNWTSVDFICKTGRGWKQNYPMRTCGRGNVELLSSWKAAITGKFVAWHLFSCIIPANIRLVTVGLWVTEELLHQIPNTVIQINLILHLNNRSPFVKQCCHLSSSSGTVKWENLQVRAYWFVPDLAPRL